MQGAAMSTDVLREELEASRLARADDCCRRGHSGRGEALKNSLDSVMEIRI